MFNREELLIIARDIKDENLLKKVNAMLYVDEELVSKLKDRYSSFDLIKIIKSNTSNEYHLHFIENEDDSKLDLIWDTIQFAKEYNNDDDLELEIHTIEHDSLEDFWCHSGIDVYTREDLADFLKNKK